MADIFELFKKISTSSPSPAKPQLLLVGLGNPGKEYEKTRHNAGFLAVDEICRQKSTDCLRRKFNALIGEIKLGDKTAMLMKPQTFMNLSGEAVGEAAEYYGISPENIIVIVDDINLEPGQMRIRKGGSAGGHNGLKSIISCLSSDAFPRIRIGVGKKPSPEYDLAAWVTGKLPEKDLLLMKDCFGVCADAAELISRGALDEAMGKYNGMNR